MKLLTEQQTADYLCEATIHTSVKSGHAIVHTGEGACGHRFVLVNDCFGNTALSESPL